MLKKEEARRLAKQYRRSISRMELKKISEKISQCLVSIPEFLQAKHVGLYYPIQSNTEISVLSVLSVTDKIYGLPKVEGKEMRFFHFRKGDALVQGEFSQREPRSSKLLSFSESDCVIIPMLFGSLQGDRIGYGGGYYDRFLSRVSVTKIGVLMKNCLTERLESHAHDVKLDVIVTESGLYRMADFR